MTVIKNTELVIIGIDGLFADHHNIDQVERAFFQGKASVQSQVVKPQTLANLCLGSVQRLAIANRILPSDIAVILVAEHHSSAEYTALETIIGSCFANFSRVKNLGEAMQQCTTAILDQRHPVAIIGINTLADDRVDEMPTARATISFDQQFEHYPSVAGLASLLMSTRLYASEQSSYIYAMIKAFDDSTDIAEAVRRCVEKAQINLSQIALLEVSALSSKQQLNAELNGLFNAYGDAKTTRLNTAMSCARSVTGEGDGFSQLAGLLRTVIALQQQYIPGMNDWQSPTEELLGQWQSSAFYFPTQSRPWFPNADGKAHIAAYSCQSANSYCHLILEENLLVNTVSKVKNFPTDSSKDSTVTNDVRRNGYMACSQLSLILLAFDDQSSLVGQLEQLEHRASIIINSNTQQDHFSVIASEYYERFLVQQNTPYCLCLIAETAEALIKEIRLAKVGATQALSEKTEWKTPKGSYFTADPVGDDNNIAFFYPGIGATYLGLGRDLFHLFPEIYQPVAALADDIGASLKDQLLYPRCLSALSFKAIKQLDSDFRNSLANIAECGVAFACVFTKIFEEVFNIRADFSVGYSMGEVSMYAALGCWHQPGLMSARLAQSVTFNHRLSGELTTLRELWNIDSSDTLKNDQDDQPAQPSKIWETYSIRSTLAEVTAAAKNEPRVFCTIINSPDNLLIGGYPEACERVIKKLGVRSMAMDMPNAIHSTPAHANYEDMEALFTMDVTERIDTKMFSSSCYLPIPHRSKAIANSIAKCLCDPVDFPRLIHALYDRGARVFIEMGPGRSLCSWTDKILKQGKPKVHASVPVNAKGTDDELTYIRALAKLVSHGVKANLDSVFNGSIVVQLTKPTDDTVDGYKNKISTHQDPNNLVNKIDNNIENKRQRVSL